MKALSMRHALVALAVLFSLALTACGGGSGSFSCSDKGSCPNDATPSSSAVAACQAALSGACGSQYQALGSCAEANATCNSSGMSTVNGSACSTQLATLGACCQSNPSASGCHQ